MSYRICVECRVRVNTVIRPCEYSQTDCEQTIGHPLEDVIRLAENRERRKEIVTNTKYRSNIGVWT